jgi:magnesium-transporting ATPase (P-type)
MYTKGSTGLLLERCDRVLIDDQPTDITSQQRQEILTANSHLAREGLRVLGFAYRPLETIPEENAEETSEQNLIWLGLVAMLDEPREEVQQAVLNCQRSGIRPIMITGDHPLTARAIASKLNIAQADDQVISGQEIAKMSPEELALAVKNVSVFWMNLVTDGLPALALALEPADPNVMTRPPYNPQESIFARGLGLYMLRIGIIFALLTIALMVWSYHHDFGNGNPNHWKTMVFTTLCLAQMGHALAVRSDKLFKDGS